MRRGAIGIVGATVAIVALAGLLAVRLGGGDERPTTTGGPAAGEVGERPAADDDDGGAVAAGPAPLAVVAVQGPVEQTARYVAVSWSHVDLDRSPVEPPRAVGYDIGRDGSVIGSVAVDDEPWDDMAFRDHDVSAGSHAYQVRARYGSGPGPWSAPIDVDVVVDADIGPIFAVDDYQGSDLERAQQAVDDAEEVGGGVVVFGADTYEFSDTLMISESGVLLRGAGADRTILRPGFPGGDDPCGPVTPLLLFRGGFEPLGVAVRDQAPRGSSTLRLDGAAPVEVGDFVQVDGVEGQFPTYEYASMGIALDPSTGRDERYPFDAGLVTAVDGDVITLDHPLSPIITAGAELYGRPWGHDNGIELLTLEGGGRDDRSYHRLIEAIDQVDFRAVEVIARWANRNFIDAGGHGITVVGLTATEGGASGYEPEPCKYKVGFGPATDVTMVDSRIGSTDNDENMSLLTMQFVYRAVLRNSVLGGSRTYAVNEHGGGSRDLVVENNWIGAGPSGWAGILLGNDTWGFGGETAIRNNRFVDNPIDVMMVENAYGVVIAGNRSTGCSQTCVTWSGWGDGRDDETPVLDPQRYGSARLAILGNRFEHAANGIDLGAEESNGYPWLGIRDAVVADNEIDVAGGTALTIRGGSDVSGRLWIAGNAFGGEIAMAEPGLDWWLWDNSAGPETAAEAWPEWAEVHQPWERTEGEP